MIDNEERSKGSVKNPVSIKQMTPSSMSSLKQKYDKMIVTIYIYLRGVMGQTAQMTKECVMTLIQGHIFKVKV